MRIRWISTMSNSNKAIEDTRARTSHGEKAKYFKRRYRTQGMIRKRISLEVMKRRGIQMGKVLVGVMVKRI
jgi:hypothetical protein